MYNRKHWVRYWIQLENLKVGGQAITINVKTEDSKRFWTWLGIYKEREVRERLTKKQFTRWKQGKQTKFIRYYKK